MKLEGLRRPDAPVGPDLAPKLAAALGKSITNAGVKPNEAWCEGACVETDRTAVQAALDSYVYDPDYFTPAEHKRLKSAVATLREWESDAATAFGLWDGWTQAQKNAATKTLTNRFGKLCGWLADFIKHQGIDGG